MDSTPLPEKLTPVPGRTRSLRLAARLKGINFNLAVLPASTASISPAHTTRTTPGGLPKVAETSVPLESRFPPVAPGLDDLKYDVPLPLTAQLSDLEIDDQLRLLALKEMAVVEIKDSIANLTTKLNRSETELHRLREVIQRSLYKELTASSQRPGLHQRQNSNPRDEAIASTKNRTRRRTLSSSTPHLMPPQTEKLPQLPASQVQNDDKRQLALWSNLLKPFNLIQQFDTMLQNEFEKSLIPQKFPEKNVQTHSKRLSEDSMSSTGSAPSPLKAKSVGPTVDLERFFASQDEVGTSRARPSEDMLQLVSTSIWSFVNDVKSNVLSSLGEDDGTKPPQAQEPMYNLDTGSTVSLVDDTSVQQPENASDDDEEDSKLDLSMYSGLRNTLDL